MSVKVAKVTRAAAIALEWERIMRLQNGRMAEWQNSNPAIQQSYDFAVSLFLQEKAAERRDHQPQRLIEAVCRDRLAGHAAGVAGIAAAVDRRITVEELGVPALVRDADPVLGAGHRCEVEDHHDEIAAVARIANE